MIFDARELERLPAGHCDVCILGGGPAGIVTALEVARARPEWRIVLAEGGGLEPPTPDDNDPYTGKLGGGAYPLAVSRLRYLGGTTNHWGGWSRFLDEEDFERRAHMPLSGWPFKRSQLADYYRKATAWCEIASTDYDVAALSPRLDSKILDLDASKVLCNRLFRFSPPTRFGTRYRDDLKNTPNLEVWLHTNALGLEFSGERVRRVRLAHPKTGVGKLDAARFVVALGGIETARFLLFHRGQGGAQSGLASPFLGTCFADHFGFRPARAVLPAQLAYERSDHPSGPLMPVICIEREVQNALKLPNVCITTIPREDIHQIDRGYPHNPALAFHAGKYWNYDLQFILEPQPNPDNRITLTDERDRLGLPRLKLDWQVHSDDRRRGERALEEVALEIGSLGLGRARINAPEDGFQRERPSVVFHHMGTTRMAENAQGGVVDADCRVHGIENLHIASSSVFPAYGFSNPTLTIVALATRLAEKLATTVPRGLHA